MRIFAALVLFFAVTAGAEAANCKVPAIVAAKAAATQAALTCADEALNANLWDDTIAVDLRCDSIEGPMMISAYVAFQNIDTCANPNVSF